jgi:hypothetical protein
MSLGRVSQISPTTLLVQWNVTWIPPTALWLESWAKSQKWTPIYCSYVHQAGQVSTFSYNAVAKLFWDAVTTQQLQIPLACIQGTTTYEFASSGQNNIMVHSITEDLRYAQDLQRGVLQKSQVCTRFAALLGIRTTSAIIPSNKRLGQQSISTTEKRNTKINTFGSCFISSHFHSPISHRTSAAMGLSQRCLLFAFVCERKPLGSRWKASGSHNLHRYE